MSSRAGYLFGYYLDKGYRPQELEQLSRDEMLTYLAIAELNEEKQVQLMRRAFQEALSAFFKGGGE